VLKLSHSVSKSKSIWGEFLWVCPFMYTKDPFICLWVVAIQKRKHPTWPATIHSINQPYTPFPSFPPNSSATYNLWWAKYCSMARCTQWHHVFYGNSCITEAYVLCAGGGTLTSNTLMVRLC